MTTIKSYCRLCNRSTNHSICAQELEGSSDGYQQETKYRIVRCLGCDGLSFRQEFHDYDALIQVADDEWEHDESVDIYPRVIEGHKEAAEIYAIPTMVRRIYQESLSAFKNDLFILTGIGFRATVEAICKEREVSGKDLGIKISNLAKGGLLSRTDADLLHSIRFIGNDAAHDIAAETRDKLSVALRIIDHLLHSVYILTNIAGTLERVVNDYGGFKALVKEKAIQTSNLGPRGLRAMMLANLWIASSCRLKTGTVRRRLSTIVAVVNAYIKEKELTRTNPFESRQIANEGKDTKEWSE